MSNTVHALPCSPFGTAHKLSWCLPCSGGSLARWLVDYDTSSSERLLKQATYEVYPAVTGSVQPTN